MGMGFFVAPVADIFQLTYYLLENLKLFKNRTMTKLLLLLLLTSCTPVRYGYGLAKFTIKKNRVKVEMLEKMHKLGDTTMTVIFIKAY